MTKWVALERYGRRSEIVVSILTEVEADGKFTRPATPEEIKVEIENREERQKERDATKLFQSRQDYHDAMTVRDILEHQEYDRNILDRLTPEQWSELRKRLES